MRRGEDGSVTPLIAMVAAVVVACVWVGACATSVYIQHRHVVALADSLADTIAYTFDQPRYYADGTEERQILTDASVERRAREVVAAVPAGVLAEVSHTRVTDARATSPHSVRVRVEAVARLPFVPSFLDRWRAGIPVAGVGDAEVAVTRGH
ncbi:MAG: hypothetical protein E7A62_04280 [Actinomycetaceae bacterium]|nr:hypothetical protein [Actinomycetaceae bacterium]MDU0970203.1 hypothetical protein [Actinomycetaceae bacterium]